METNAQTLLPMQREQCNSVSLSQTQNSLSVFRNDPPATDEQLQTFGATMQAAFPQVKMEFWVITAKMLRRDKVSNRRLQYIMESMIRGWKYPTMQIADILAIDKNIKIWSFDEFYREFKTTAVQGYCILKDKGRDGKIQFCLTADAQQAGLEIIRTL